MELTGTGLEKSNSNVSEEMRKISHSERELSFNEDKKDLNEQEETVKDMVNRLEMKNVAPTKPRIIESKCIEKATKDLGPKVTINHSFEQVKSHPSENVTVNNHMISMSKTLQPDESDTASLKSKVVRNKNVDSALETVMKRNDNLKNLKPSWGDTENLALKESFRELPELSHIRQSKWGSTCKMESVEMVKNQDKINNCALIKCYPKTESATKSAQKSTTGAEEKSIKMVNWSTVGNTLGKEYIANDSSLVQAKIYDEMEFEEFEVIGEHYDSLNSK